MAEIQIPIQTEKLLAALDKIGTPRAARIALTTFAQQSAAIRSQQYKASKRESASRSCNR